MVDDVDFLRCLKMAFKIGLEIVERLEQGTIWAKYEDMVSFVDTKCAEDGGMTSAEKLAVISIINAILSPWMSITQWATTIKPVFKTIMREIGRNAQSPDRDTSMYPHEWAYQRALELGCSMDDAVAIMLSVHAMFSDMAGVDKGCKQNEH